MSHYNIPRKIRELQCVYTAYDLDRIITYQEKLGNYNNCFDLTSFDLIITYQEKLGNYNNIVVQTCYGTIITYQEKLGNYNTSVCAMSKT